MAVCYKHASIYFLERDILDADVFLLRTDRKTVSVHRNPMVGEEAANCATRMFVEIVPERRLRIGETHNATVHYATDTENTMLFVCTTKIARQTYVMAIKNHHIPPKDHPGIKDFVQWAINTAHARFMSA
jgi:hypothetical protein